MGNSVSVLLSRFKRGAQKFRSDPNEWLRLSGDRLVIASVLTVAFTLCVLTLQYTNLVVVTDTTQMLYVFQGLVAGNLTLVTIVLSINQLILAREFNSPGELEDRIENAIDYRSDVKEITNNASVPVTPVDFLTVLLEGTQSNARQFKEAVESGSSDRLAEDADALVADLISETDRLLETLDRVQPGIFSALIATLETNFSHQLSEAFRIRTVYEDDLTPTTSEYLDALIRSLKLVDIGRQYFKTIYMQSELARLSRTLLFAGVLSIGSGILTLLVYASTAKPPLEIVALKVLVPAVIVLGFVPLALLFSFILRIATVALRTVAITPFTTPPQESGSVER